MPDVSGIPETVIPEGELQAGMQLLKPVFIGHYWLAPSAPKDPLTAMVACLDYSVGKGGPLVAIDGTQKRQYFHRVILLLQIDYSRKKY